MNIAQKAYVRLVKRDLGKDCNIRKLVKLVRGY